MKGKFEVPHEDYLRVQVVLKKHEPFITMAVSSTGLNNSTFKEHQPTRVFCQEYVFDEKNKEYVPGIHFDRMIKCSAQALNAALSNNDYDVFAQGGIDKTAYMNGDGVLAPSAFRKEFSDFLKGTVSDTTFIANNSRFCIEMLESIACADELKEIKAEHKLLDQPAITKAFFKEHGLDAQAGTLEALRNYIDKTQDNTEKIVGVDNRCKMMGKFVEFCGREKGTLISQEDALFNRISNTYIEDMSERGREKYRSSTIDDKLSTLVESNRLDTRCTERDFQCDLNRFYDVLDGKEQAKGIVIMHCATTDINPPLVPIQFSASVYPIENGKLSPVPETKLSMDIEADARSIQKALSRRDDMNPRKRFDAFKFTGIDYDNAYSQGKMTTPDGQVSGKALFSEKKAATGINSFFERYSPDEYPIVTISKDKEGKRGFAQAAIAGLGNLPVVDAPSIDFSQLIKEYVYAVHNDKTYDNNVLFDESKDLSKFGGFSFKDIAAANNEDIDPNAAHVGLRCALIGKWLSAISEQHSEMLMQKNHDRAEEVENTVEPSQNAENRLPEEQGRGGEKKETPVLVAPVQQTFDTIPPYMSEPDVIQSTDPTPTYRDMNFEGEYPEKYYTGEELFAEEGYDNILEAVNIVNQPVTNVELNQNEHEEREVFTSRRERAKDKTDFPEKLPHENETNPVIPAVEEAKDSNQLSQDVAALINAMAAQTNAMTAQMNAVNTQISVLVEQNNSLINAVVVQSKALTKTLENTIEILADRYSDRHLENVEKDISAMERLEKVKEEIASIFKELPPSGSAKDLLKNANEIISKGQTAMEKQEVLEKPPAKTGKD